MSFKHHKATNEQSSAQGEELQSNASSAQKYTASSSIIARQKASAASSALVPRDIRQLQRALGNQAVQRLLTPRGQQHIQRFSYYEITDEQIQEVPIQNWEGLVQIIPELADKTPLLDQALYNSSSYIRSTGDSTYTLVLKPSNWTYNQIPGREVYRWLERWIRIKREKSSTSIVSSKFSFDPKGIGMEVIHIFQNDFEENLGGQQSVTEEVYVQNNDFTYRLSKDFMQRMDDFHHIAHVSEIGSILGVRQSYQLYLDKDNGGQVIDRSGYVITKTVEETENQGIYRVTIRKAPSDVQVGEHSALAANGPVAEVTFLMQQKENAWCPV